MKLAVSVARLHLCKPDSTGKVASSLGYHVNVNELQVRLGIARVPEATASATVTELLAEAVALRAHWPHDVRVDLGFGSHVPGVAHTGEPCPSGWPRGGWARPSD
jgi:hypothetical protein